MFEYNFRKVQYNYIFEIGGWMTRVKKKRAGHSGQIASIKRVYRMLNMQRSATVCAFAHAMESRSHKSTPSQDANRIFY